MRTRVTVLTCSVMAALVVGGLVWWQYKKSSPEYSLALLADAAHKGDSAAVESFVNTDRIVGELVSHVPGSESGIMLAPLGQVLGGGISIATPQLSSVLRPLITEQVTACARELSTQSEGKPFVLAVLAVSSVADVARSGDVAEVTIRSDEGVVKFRMERDGERWKIVSVSNEALVTRASAIIRNTWPVSAPSP
jgi:hypothetical protein